MWCNENMIILTAKLTSIIAKHVSHVKSHLINSHADIVETNDHFEKNLPMSFKCEIKTQIKIEILMCQKLYTYVLLTKKNQSGL